MHKNSEDDSSEGEDLLGEDTPQDDTSDEHEHDNESENTRTDSGSVAGLLSADVKPTRGSTSGTEREQLFTGAQSNTLRSRSGHETEQPLDTGATSSASVGASLSTAETILSHNRTEQEILTGSLLDMAQALKASSQAFADSLESEKAVVDRAVEGLDRNSSGLEAASKRMGYLRRMSEGKGWWGRILLYAWIAGLSFLAFFIVMFLPKLRF